MNFRLSIIRDILFLLLVLGAFGSASVQSKMILQNQNPILAGESPRILLSGLPKNQIIRLHSLREMQKWERDQSGQWKQVSVILHAWADFNGGRTGRVDVDQLAPISGSYKSAGSTGLVWSGYPLGDAALNAVQAEFDAASIHRGPGITFFVTQKNRMLAQSNLLFEKEDERVTFTEIQQDGWSGVFASPRAKGTFPVVIILHGSEGGSMEKARMHAARFAARGFAALAVNYFVYPHEAVAKTPSAHINIRVEVIDEARNWLKQRTEVDIDRIALWGVSKGAEFTVIAASKYNWIDAAVACVPSDAVWEGYGREPLANEAISSWSWQGKALPYIKLFPFVETNSLFKTNTERYEKSRAAMSNIDATLIPIENSKAHFLLVGADRDEVWASGAMTRKLEQRLKKFGKSKNVSSVIYPRAGHQICGDGAFTSRLYNTQSDDPELKEVTAEGEAQVDAWRRTIQFLRRHL